MTTSSYLNSIKSGAIEGWHTHKIAPSITGAQAALESGWGTSSLAKPPYNNNFGIKASAEWTGRTVTMPTREWLNGKYVTVNASFRAYDSIADSVRDHAAFFTNTEWREENYKHVVGERDYKKAARELQKAGYATDPSYATKLINIIEQYQLFKWDTEAYSGVSQPTESTRPTINPQPQSKVVGKDLSNAGREYVKTASISVIGDSLGVGTKPYLEQLIPDSNYDVVGSRQITHTQASLNATTALRNMLNAGTLKNTVIVIIGTNRGVTQREVEDFVDIAGTSRKILFVDTASQVNHAPEVSRVYKNVSSSRSNVFYVNWRDYALSSREAWYYADGAGGTYIHMNPTGYRRHAEYIAQAIYEADNSSFSQPGDVAIDTETYYAHIGNLELGPDGIIEYEATSADGEKKTFTKDLGVKGFYSPKGDMAIYNPEANEKWNNKHDDEFNANWIEAYFEESEIGLDVTLMERAVRYLDEHREPSAQYRIQLADIPQTLSIGDTGVFIDHDYNPPLYIEARVLELTTSRTNPSQNTVLIGNVVELQPQEKGWVHTMQQGLQQMRESLHNDWINRDELTVSIKPLNSTTLTESETSAFLSVKVMRGTIDVTEYFERFEWERMSESSTDDVAYNQILSETENSSTLEVTKDDLYNNEATFTVRVYDGETLVEKSSITIKHVDTALWVDTDTPPTYAKDGATWVDETGKQWVKKDGEWEERVDQSQLFSISSEVEGAMAEAEQAKADAKKAYDDAVAEAERLVIETDVVWQGKMEEYDEQVALIDASATNAQTKAEQALTEAGISTDLAQTAKDLADTAKNNVAGALAEASEAKTQAGQAFIDAKTAQTDAQTAMSDAQSALSKADGVESTVNTISSEVDTIAGKVELKANQTDVDTVKGTVSTHTTTLSQHATAISSKAEKSVVDTISGKVSTNTTTISQNATAISSKAEQEEVDTVKGTVSTHTTTLEQHATAISARLTESQVNTLVSGKGYATQTWSNQTFATPQSITTALKSYAKTTDLNGLATESYVGAQISATASGINTSLTRIENKVDDIEFGGANLIKNSEDLSKKMGGYSGATSTVKPIDMTEEWGFSRAYEVTLGAGTNTIKSVWTSIDEVTEPMVPGQKYTHSFWIKNLGSSNGMSIYVNGLEPYSPSTYLAPGESIRFQYTGVRRRDYDWYQIHFRSMDAGSVIKFAIGRFQLEKGNKATDWSPAPYDVMDYTNTQIDVKAGQVEQLITDVKTNPSGTITGYNSLKNNVDSMVQAIGSTGGKIAQMVMTDSVFKTTVAKQSDVFKNYRIYAMSYSNRNATWAKWSSSRIIKPDGSLASSNASHTDRSYFLYVINEAGNEVHSKVYDVYSSSTQATALANDIKSFTNRQYLIFLMGSHAPTNNRTAGGLPQAIYQIGGSPEIFINENWSGQPAYLLIGKPGLGQGRGYEYFVPSSQGGSFDITVPVLNGSTPFIDSSIQAVNTQVTQLADSWALTLKSGNDIKTQINASTNSIRLQSKFIHLNGSSLIDNATIKSAHIDSLNANKITGNTADFNTVRARVLVADVVTSTHIKASEALIDNIFGNTAYINKLTSKTAFINSIKAIDISADKISGGTLTGTTFLTTENGTGFSTQLSNGKIEFKHQIFSLGSINATVNGSTGVVNGFAVTQRPGYIFSINSQSNLPGNNSSKPVIQVPAESTAENRKLNIYAQGGLQLYSDVLNIESDMIIAKKPLRINGLVASHAQTDAGAKIGDAGNLMYSIDKAGSVMIHRLMVRNKAGSWPNSGIALYEDGRVAVVVKGVWKQL